MNIVVYGKTMKNLTNGIDVKLLSNKKDYLKGKLYSTQNIWQWFSWDA